MGALFQSRGWLPIVEAPGYFRHQTSILVMQLLMHHHLVYFRNRQIGKTALWNPGCDHAGIATQVKQLFFQCASAVN